MEEPKSIRQNVALLSDPGKKAGPNKEKGGSRAQEGENDLLRVIFQAKRFLDTPGRLPREKQDEAFEVLNGLREWMKGAAVDVRATRVG